MRVLIWSIYHVILKDANLEGGSGQQKTLNQVQAAVQSTLPLEHYDTAHLMSVFQWQIGLVPRVLSCSEN